MALALGLGSAWAQTLPSAAEPGREPLRPVMPQSTGVAVPVQVPQSPSAEAPAGAKDVSFVLKALQIEGATAYTPEALRPLYDKLLDRQVTVAEVFAAANAIELKYRNAGYVTSRVIVPQQTVKDGRFRIVVIEGYVSNVVFQGDIGPAGAAVERLVASLRGIKPVSVAEIERRLLLANDLPGLTVRGTLEPSPDAQGGSVLVVRSERDATDASVTLDNRASAYLGRGQLYGTHAWNAIGARADRVTLSAKTSLDVERSAALSVGYDALVSDAGATFGLAASYAQSKPGRELELLDVQSRVTSAVSTITLPLVRSREENLRVVGQFEARNVDTDLAGTAFNRDRLRILRGGVSYDLSDRYDGITTVRGMLHQGLSGLGASANGSAQASRLNGRSDFTKLTLDLTRLQQLGPRTSLLASVTGQYSDKPLLASEEIGIGGASFGRAYDEGEVAADNGVAATLELRYVPAGLPRNVQLYGYLDGGRVRAASGGNPVTISTLTSFGGGLRAALLEHVYASLEIAKPMSAVVRTQGDKRPRAFVSLTAQF